MAGKISKSELKRRCKREEKAASELAQLSDSELKRLPVSADLKQEILRCRSVKGGARNRQIKYVTKLLREESAEEVLSFLAVRKGSKLKENNLQHEAERLRDLLVSEAIEDAERCRQQRLAWETDWPAAALEDLVQRYHIDEGELRRAVYQFVRTRQHNHYRTIFRVIKAAIEKNEMLAGHTADSDRSV
ncbi:MAG: hypothetical protein CSA20_04030 [Deltaproteobacteria bacterium]|nr:MAG: hypothetical protein CSA20_04030 [Deltaproteobacteria bacterium]